MTPESSLGVTNSDPGAGANLATDSPSVTPGTGTSSADVNLQPGQGETTTPQTEVDPLVGFPPDEELAAAVANKTPYAEMAARIKSAYQPLKTQFSDLQTRFQPVEPFLSHLERFEKPEDLQQIVDFREKLYGWEKDPHSGQLVPATQSLVQELTAAAPERADYLSADLLNGITRDPQTGREMTRLDLALEAIAEDPVRRAKALSVLGGVEPNSIAPTWQPTVDELERIPEELQDTYKKLPYDERQSLNASDPEIVKRYLNDQKFKDDVRDRDARQEASDRLNSQRRDQYIESEATNAGNQAVQERFVEGFTGFQKNICEKFQPIKPIDPGSPEAQAMTPEHVTQTNAQIQRINQGAGGIVATVTAALAHPETRFLFEGLAKEIGITDEMLQKFDEARLEFAASNRNFGYLRTKATFGQNGNGQALPQDIGMLQTAAQQAQRRLMAHGQAIAEPIQKLLSEFFSLQATTHTNTLNGPTARPVISGTGYDPTAGGQQRPRATSEAEIMQRARESAQQIAARR